MATESDDSEHTCGKGIAASSGLPEAMSAVMSGMAGVFENHIRALDPQEDNGRKEIEAYQRLAAEHRDLGGRLEALGSLMRGYRDLPMASHDMDVIMDKTSLDAFVAMVDYEKKLLALIQERVAEHDGMLQAMHES
jgi:hypothetical protein